MSIQIQHESHDLSAPGATVGVDLTDKAATLLVGQPDEQVEIEITPTGPLPGDYFVGTFKGGRIIAVVRLGEDYDTVQETDLIHMVEAERDVGDFPRIAVVTADGTRRLQVIGRGAPARLELQALPEFVPQAA
jgi:hypothetical protein